MRAQVASKRVTMARGLQQLCARVRTHARAVRCAHLACGLHATRPNEPFAARPSKFTRWTRLHANVHTYPNSRRHALPLHASSPWERRLNTTVDYSVSLSLPPQPVPSLGPYVLCRSRLRHAWHEPHNHSRSSFLLQSARDASASRHTAVPLPNLAAMPDRHPVAKDRARGATVYGKEEAQQRGALTQARADVREQPCDRTTSNGDRIPYTSHGDGK